MHAASSSSSASRSACDRRRVEPLFELVEQRRILAAELADVRERSCDGSRTVRARGSRPGAPACCSPCGARSRKPGSSRASSSISRSRCVFATIEAAAIEKLMPSPLLKQFCGTSHARDRCARRRARAAGAIGNASTARRIASSAGVVDVDAVDLLDFGAADADAVGRLRGSAARPPRAARDRASSSRRCRELRVRREHHGGGDHGSGERAHADLVDARDVLHARAPQDALEVQHRVEPRALGAARARSVS